MDRPHPEHEEAAFDAAGAEARPRFPRRAVVTAGMPYGNKELHLGHIGGVFVHADAFARFLRDRIGKENVLFVSGTDGYGSPIVEYHRQATAGGEFTGTIEAFVALNHRKQAEVLRDFHISLDLFAASSIGRPAEIHREVSAFFLHTLYENGWLRKITTSQFYDPEAGVFLNGRQVVGYCPIQGCGSERGYADECALGHQYMPTDLIHPTSTLSGKTPEMRDVTNWYFALDAFRALLAGWLDALPGRPCHREFVRSTVQEFLEPPAIYVKRELLDQLAAIAGLPPHTVEGEENKPTVRLVFGSLREREQASRALAAERLRFRTSKTLVPFRLTGNVEWGVPAPALEGLDDLTFWVWPESLWAPISFTQAYLEGRDDGRERWTAWWCSPEARVYQFIGEDNVYFYGPAEMAMFLAMQGGDPSPAPPDGQLQLPELIVNKHILFLDKKASSSGAVKPPTAKELLDYYTPDQLRAHFLGLGLGSKSVGFAPKPLNPKARETDSDPVLNEGNLLSNAFNRAVRSCFYAAQKHFDGRIPVREVSPEILDGARQVILQVERSMAHCRLHQVLQALDAYIRDINSYWTRQVREADERNDDDLRAQTVVDAFHMVRTATVLLHPIAPEGTEMVREYLQLDDRFWDWTHIFDPLAALMANPHEHQLKHLEPRVDFFRKHPSQVQQYHKP
ncbi:MAG: class I tRNA ligase family protein [Armatimonadota bacterium]